MSCPSIIHLTGAMLAASSLMACLPATAVETRQTPIPLPINIQAAHAIKIALFASFPPMAWRKPENNQLVGIDVDLADYLGKRLGVTIQWEEVSYESAINSLMTGRVDMAFSLLDAPEATDRLDYLPYLNSGMQPYTLTSHAPIASALDICGLKVSANRRNAFDAAMRTWSDAHCLTAGRPAIQVQPTDGTATARLDLKQGRADVAVQSSESVPTTMALEKGTYVTIGGPLNSLAIVAAFPKHSAQLRQAISQALKDAVADGSYAAALAKYGLTENSAANDILSH
ncbi:MULTISPECIES: transporter substrate-binding domain-containing protein [unclassified Pseudomonas]|uniref:transporter substrate-binding domain-containing protein n=1 Tax=unclassified Pseudomonas TaxID=196821 RepID=UPI0025D55070|nr:MULTISPECIES: transporter substrate-binding domain-containing protein [unclassified Pseudomonas]